MTELLVIVAVLALYGVVYVAVGWRKWRVAV